MNTQSKVTLLFCILLTACYSGGQGSEEGAERLKAYTFTNPVTEPIESLNNDYLEIDVDNVTPEYALASEVFINREYIELKTPPNVIIGKIHKIQIDDRYMVILDRFVSKRVFLFKTDGEFIHAVGKVGSGPGEHQDPIDVSIKGEHVYVTDRQFAVNVYTLRNEHVESFYLPFYGGSSHVFNDGTIAFSNNELLEEEVAYHLIMINGKDISGRLFKGKHEGLSHYTAPPLSHNPTVHDDSFLFYTSHSNEIYQVGKDIVKLKYQIKTNKPIPDEVLDNFNRLSAEQGEYTNIFNWPILETDSKTQIRISKGGVMTIFLDTRSEEIKAYGGIKDDLLYGGIMDFPIYAHGDKFYAPLHVEQMYSMKMQIENIKDEELLAELREARPEVFKLMENIDEISNPVIMKCDIN